MFTDQSFEPTSFTSQTSTEKSQNASNVQTDAITYESRESQKNEQRSTGTQTSEAARPKPHVDYERLASFLKRVTPGMIEVLDEVYGTDAFEGYNPGSSNESMARVQLLSSLYTCGNEANNKKLSDVSWSTGGGILATGYSATYHKTWCDHLSDIKFYKITSDDKLEETAIKTLEVQACVTHLSYHPSEPSILAAGLFNGDVFLWNFRDDEFVTPLQICTHGDTVTSLLWISKNLKESTIVTTSADGYVLVNRVTGDYTNVIMEKKLKISKEHNPVENSRPRSSGGRRERAVEAGLSLTCLDFSSTSPGFFVVGTLCGGIYKCSLEKSMPIDPTDADDNENIIFDPVVGEYERHEGSVTCIKCSPTRNVFLTCGTEKEIRIYDFEQANRLQTISLESTVIGLSWYTKADRDIIGAYGASSSVDFYDAANGKALSKLQMQSTRENTSCLAFNHKRDFAAVGDTQGKLELWKISIQGIS